MSKRWNHEQQHLLLVLTHVDDMICSHDSVLLRNLRRLLGTSRSASKHWPKTKHNICKRAGFKSISFVLRMINVHHKFVRNSLLTYSVGG
jgi:hypothetical protein